MTFDLSVLSGYWPELAAGLGSTVWLCASGAAMSGVLGVLLTIGQRRGGPWLAAVIRGYTALTLGLPLLVLLYVMFFVLPDFGVLLPAPLVGTVTLAVYYGPYVAEVIKAAVAAVPAGTVEAGVAIYMVTGCDRAPHHRAASAAAAAAYADGSADRPRQRFRVAIGDLCARIHVRREGRRVRHVRAARSLFRRRDGLLGRDVRHPLFDPSLGAPSRPRPSGRPAPVISMNLSDSTPPVALRARGIVKSFGANRILDGVDLTVARGETVCVLGPSGSGKSTLLRCLNWLSPPDEGAIWIGGERIGLRENPNGATSPRPDREIRALSAAVSAWCFKASTYGRT